MYNQIAFFITADFALLILLYCLKAFFLPDGTEKTDLQS